MMILRPEKAEDGLYYYDGVPQPECFGLLWDGENNDDTTCQECAFGPWCQSEFVATLVVDAVGAVGRSPAPVAQRLSITEESAAKALALAEPQLKATKKKRPPKNPTRAGAIATNAKAPALTEQRMTDAAPNASAPAEKGARRGPKGPHGERTWPGKWNRERARNKKIRALKRGQVLEVTRRLHHDQETTYRLKVLQGRYRLLNDGTEHPTLYKATEHIAGRARWSGPKFWNLV